MDIKNAKYVKSTETGNNTSVFGIIDGQEWGVPMNPNNRHYAEILKQVKEGTLTIKDAE